MVSASLQRLSEASTLLLQDSSFKPPHSSGPFTTALLSSDFLSVLRDAEGSERDMFKYIGPSPTANTSASSNEREPTAAPVPASTGGSVVLGNGPLLERIAPEMSTPLRTGVGSKDDSDSVEDADILLKAASKLVADYGPKPRLKRHIAQLLQKNINLLTKCSEIESRIEMHTQPASTSSSTKPDAAGSSYEEEYRAVEQECRELERRKKAAAEVKKGGGTPSPSRRSPLRAARPAVGPSSSPSSKRQPVASQQQQQQPSPSFAQIFGKRSINNSKLLASPQPIPGGEDSILSSSIPADDYGVGDESMLTDTALPEYGDDQDGDVTVVLPSSSGPTVGSTPPPATSKHPLKSPRQPSASPKTPPAFFTGKSKTTTPSPLGIKTPIKSSSRVAGGSDAVEEIGEIKITSEIEGVVAKLWSTQGDTLRLSPAAESLSSFETLNGDETISLLRGLSASTVAPVPASPTSSTSTTLLPAQSASLTPQLILCCNLLLILLSSEGLSLPKSTLTEKVASVAKARGWDESLATKAIFWWVAKKVLTINRKRGVEGWVEFI